MLVQPAATRVRDPQSGRSVWLAGMVRDIRMDDGTLRYTIVFGEHSASEKSSIREALEANLRGVGYPGPIAARMRTEKAEPQAEQAPAEKAPVRGMYTEGMAPHGGPVQKKKLGGVSKVVAVASGKGGVGKSTVTSNLAVALQRAGLAVGVLDADIYGPSQHVMLNITTPPMANAEQKLVPALAYGVRCASMGMLVDADEAIIWRGPMVMSAIRQLLQETVWGELDVLLIDLPPGTGDAQLTIIQGVDLDGAVVVTTPQDVALADAVRGVRMFTKLDVPVLGVVENMAYYALPDGTRDYVFGKDGGKRMAQNEKVPLLAEIPLATSIRKGGDSGLPAALGNSPQAAAFAELATAVQDALR